MSKTKLNPGVQKTKININSLLCESRQRWTNAAADSNSDRDDSFYAASIDVYGEFSFGEERFDKELDNLLDPAFIEGSKALSAFSIMMGLSTRKRKNRANG